MAKKDDKKVFPLAALVLAWLIPGAGHIYAGRVKRGIIIFVMIAAMFWGGVAMGGVMTVDKETQRWWFVADLFTGIHGLVSWRRSQAIYKRLHAELMNRDDYQESMQELARKYRRIPPSEAVKMRQQYYSAILAEEGLVLVPPTEVVARAYAGVAGLLNLMCVFDAVILSLMGMASEPAASAKTKRGTTNRAEAA